MISVVCDRLSRVAAYLFSGACDLRDEGLYAGDVQIAADIRSETHCVEPADTPPPGAWVGGGWSFVAGVWSVADQSLINAARIREIDERLSALDLAFDPRWHEDARAGTSPYAREQAWLDERAALRAERAALSA